MTFALAGDDENRRALRVLAKRLSFLHTFCTRTFFEKDTTYDRPKNEKAVLNRDLNVRAVLYGDLNPKTVLNGDLNVRAVLNRDLNVKAVLNSDLNVKAVLNPDLNVKAVLNPDLKVKTIQNPALNVKALLIRYRICKRFQTTVFLVCYYCPFISPFPVLICGNR